MEQLVYKDHWIDIFHDPDCPNPRDWGGSFLFVTVAEACLISDAEVDKWFFDGLTTTQRYCEAIANHVGGIYIFPVTSTSQSGQTHFTMYAPSDIAPYDVQGFMVYTDTHAETWGTNLSEHDAWRQMRDELTEYEQWLNGDCWGWVIRTFYGCDVDSEWGYIGYDNAVAAARAFIDRPINHQLQGGMSVV